MKRLQLISDWRTIPVKLFDIRRVELRTGDEARPYRLPANAFLFAIQGEAELLLDGVPYKETRDQLLHVGKGASLTVQSLTYAYEYYLILYKTLDKLSPSSRQTDDSIPAFHRYLFQSKQPWLLRPLLDQMHPLWRDGGELEKLKVTGLFYQFVHEQFRQWETDTKEEVEPDLAEEIAQYVRRHYRQPISMETIAQSFHYSTHYLARVFRRKYGCSPLVFLVRTRMNHAKRLLEETEAPIRDIADIVGYPDMYYFNRLFKKQLGVTPVQFKMQVLSLRGSIRPKFTSNSFIAPQTGPDYSVDSNSDNHYQPNSWSVNEVNLNLNIKPTLAVSLLFALTLLLSACGGSNSADERNAAVQGSQSAAASPEASQEASSGTRAYTDALGTQVEIPVQPQKAVIVTYGGYLLPLGLKPVGVDEGTKEQYPEEFADVGNIGAGLGSEEAILALQPDLIIVPDYFDAASYENYRKIAPTIAVAWGGDPDVVNTLRTMGDIMNRKTEAEAWIAKFEEKLQRIRDQIDVKLEPGTTALSFIHYEGEFLIGGEGGTLGKLIYKDYGFELPAQLKQYADGGTALSEEAFVDQPADYFFTQMSDEEYAAFREMIKAPLYQSIPAVQADRIINVSRDLWNYGPYLVDKGVDALIEQMNRLKH